MVLVFVFETQEVFSPIFFFLTFCKHYTDTTIQRVGDGGLLFHLILVIWADFRVPAWQLTFEILDLNQESLYIAWM